MIANQYFPATTPGTHFSATFNLSIGVPVVYQQIDVVSDYKGEIQVFHTTPAKVLSPSDQYVNKINPGFPTNIGKVSFTSSPQVDVSITGGPIYGKKMLSDRTDAFGGDFIQNGGSVGWPDGIPVGVSVEQYVSFDKQTNKPDPDQLNGFDSGVSVGYPFVSVNRMAVTSKPIRNSKVQLSGVGLLGCRMIHFCGR